MATLTITCENCGKQFEAQRRTRRFCSPECRSAPRGTDPTSGILALIDTDGDHDMWRGTVGKEGPVYRNNYGYIIVRRFLWEQRHGTLRRGVWVLPACDVENCVRLDHMQVGTRNDFVDKPSKTDSKAAAFADPKVLSAAMALIDRDGDCWMWTGKIDTKGYGVMRTWRDGYTHIWRAHRFIYEHFVGPIDQPHLDHLCRRRACVNPAHLEPVTHRENLLRGVGPASRGRATHCARGHEFTEDNTYVSFPSDRRHPKRQCRACMHMASGVTDDSR